MGIAQGDIFRYCLLQSNNQMYVRSLKWDLISHENLVFVEWLNTAFHPGVNLRFFTFDLSDV